MYLAPEHSPDILISYSHGDIDATGQSELKRWSQGFAAALESELRQDREFRDVAVFLDESRRSENAIDRTLPLTEQLRRKVKGAGLLSILMCPQYLESTWCRDERAWWLEEQTKRSDARGRVFVCRILPTNNADWPRELCDERGNPYVGFWFHTRENTGAAVRAYGWRGRTDEQNAFTMELLNLVGALSQRLREYKGQIDAARKLQAEKQRLAAEGGQTLYLYAREERRDAWERAYAALGESRFVVVPAAPEPRAESPERLREITDERIKQLVACDALLLLGTNDGFALDGDMLSIGRQSRQLARARSGKLLPCAVLAAEGARIRTPERMTLARKLGIDWLDETPGLPQTLHDWLFAATERLDIAA